MKKIEFFRHSIDEIDRKRVNAVLRSIFLTTGEIVGEFEQAFSEYVGCGHAIGLTSCTAALHLSLLALGIGPGDEVITTPMSFCASANAILHAGAKPVFVDVETDTGNINAELIEKAITGRTKAIIPVHLYGHMCDMKRVRAIADEHQMKIIEDAAHAIEASRDGIRVGELADTACFSFYATKNITSGEGGAITTKSNELANKISMLRLHGIDKGAADRYTKRFQHYDMPILGWKYNMDNIQAALLVGQLKRIDDLWKKRERVWKLYQEGLRDINGIQLPRMSSNMRHAFHLFTIRVDSKVRDDLLNRLQDRGIGVAVNFRPIHLLEYYRKTYGYRAGSYPVAEQIGASTISLPFYPLLKDDDVRYIIEVLIEEIDK